MLFIFLQLRSKAKFEKILLAINGFMCSILISAIEKLPLSPAGTYK